MPLEVRLEVRRFDKALHDRSAFSCGHKGIDNYLKQSITDAEKADYVRAYMATEPGSKLVIGFYTLQAHSVQPEYIPIFKKPPPTIPAIYLKAVAVDQSRQGQKLGTALMIHALTECCKMADNVGIAVVILDVLHGDDHSDRRRQFYEGLGFLPMKDPNNEHRFFIRIKDVRQTLEV